MEKTEIKITTTHDDGSQFNTTVDIYGVDVEAVGVLIERALLGHGYDPHCVSELFGD